MTADYSKVQRPDHPSTSRASRGSSQSSQRYDNLPDGDKHLLRLRTMYRDQVRTFKGWWKRVHDAEKTQIDDEYLKCEYLHAQKGKDPTNNGKAYHDWASNDDEMRRRERLIAGRLPFNPMNAREVDEMRRDWSRNGYLRQNKSIIFEISVIAMQQVIAEYYKLPEFKGEEYVTVGKELDIIKDSMNKKEWNLSLIHI